MRKEFVWLATGLATLSVGYALYTNNSLNRYNKFIKNRKIRKIEDAIETNNLEVKLLT